MKILKIILVIFLVGILVFSAWIVGNIYLFPKSPRAIATFENENLQLKIAYYRPYKKDRLIFGDQENGALVPFGEYWRLGANLVTKLKTNRDISFAGRQLNKGSYGLYAYPYSDHWLLIIHRKNKGSSYNEPPENGIILRVNTPTYKLNEEVEQFTIDFIQADQKEVIIRFQWDNTGINIPIE